MRYLFIFFLSFFAFADEAPFDQGLKAYQAKNYEEAKTAFEKALAARPEDPAVSYNLGLVYMALGKRGMAVGYWRRALEIDARQSAAASALEKTEDKYHFSRLEKSPWALYLHSVFERVGWDFWFAFLGLSWALCGWLWLSFFKERKAARLSEDAETPQASWAAIGSAILFTVGILAAAGKYLDDQKERGVVVNAAAELKSAPSADGVTLQSLPEASEVQILRAHEDWLQIQNGEGTVGWVKKSDLLATTKGIAW